MHIGELKQIIKKYQLSDMFEGNHYLCYGEVIVWKYKKSFYDENPFYHKENDENVIFKIEIDDFDLAVKNSDLKKNISNMYMEIIEKDWLSFKQNYLDNEIDFSNKKFLNEIKTFTGHNRFIGLKEDNIKVLINLVTESIKKDGVKNDNYSVIFDMLESILYMEGVDFMKDTSDIYKQVKQTMIDVIKENPKFYNEERKFITYKKIYCDVFRKKENLGLIHEINEAMNFTPDLDYYKILENNGEIIIYPNVNYSFLNKFDKKYSDFNKKSRLVENILDMLIEKNGTDFLENFKMDTRELIDYNNFHVFKCKTNNPQAVYLLINKIVELIEQNKNVIRNYDRTSTLESKDKAARLYIEQYLLEDVIKLAREISLRGKLNNKECAKVKKKI